MRAGVARLVPPLACLVLCIGAPLSGQAEPPPPLPTRPVAFPPFQERTLSNGARLLVVAQDEVSFVTVNLVLRSGSVVDPADRVGTAALAAELLTKVTTTASAVEIADAIDFLGGTLDASASSDWITISLGVLEPDLARGLELLADVVINPTFPEDELELLRTRALSGLEASLGSPAVRASRAFTRAVYGDHAYGKLDTPETLQAIDRASLQRFHETWFRPGNGLFVVVGSVSADRAARAGGHFPRLASGAGSPGRLRRRARAARDRGDSGPPAGDHAGGGPRAWTPTTSRCRAASPRSAHSWRPIRRWPPAGAGCVTSRPPWS